jgi:hypothetical protein
MKFKHFTIVLILLLISSFYLDSRLMAYAATSNATSSFYVGVDVAYESLPETMQLIDNVSSYTNFFIIGCVGDYNETRLTIISQYALDKGLSFAVYSDDPRYPSKQWMESAKSTFGSRFLGFYYYDEPGGKQLDQATYPVVTSAINFSDAADKYVDTLNRWLRNSSFAITRNFDYPTEFPICTSDYGLYWYDYLAGYDTVFAEFGWKIGWENSSRQLNIALCRGAAIVMNRDWGVMITWAYEQPPYMESGPELYNDMVMAYENGAKYILVFDSNKEYTQNVLQQDQLNAMKQFWQYTRDNPRTVSQPSERSAYVLPEDYGFGFRSPHDKIWGLWNADYDASALNFTTGVGMSVATLLQMFGSDLDIVYPTQNQTIESVGYQNVVYWNDTRLLPDIPIIPNPSPVTSVSGQPTISPYFQNGNSLIVYLATTALGVTAVSILIAAAVVVTVFWFEKRRRKPTQTSPKFN